MFGENNLSRISGRGSDQMVTMGQTLARDAVNRAEQAATFAAWIGDVERSITVGVELEDKALLRVKGGDWYPIEAVELREVLSRRYAGESVGRGEYQIFLREQEETFYYDIGRGDIRSSSGVVWLVRAMRII